MGYVSVDSASATTYRAPRGGFSTTIYNDNGGRGNKDIGTQIRQDYRAGLIRPLWRKGFVFNYAKYLENPNNRKLTYGDLKKRYDLPDHAIRKMNDFRGISKDTNIDNLAIRTGQVQLPPKAIENYLN